MWFQIPAGIQCPNDDDLSGLDTQDRRIIPRETAAYIICRWLYRMGSHQPRSSILSRRRGPRLGSNVGSGYRAASTGDRRATVIPIRTAAGSTFTTRARNATSSSARWASHRQTHDGSVDKQARKRRSSLCRSRHATAPPPTSNSDKWGVGKRNLSRSPRIAAAEAGPAATHRAAVGCHHLYPAAGSLSRRPSRHALQNNRAGGQAVPITNHSVTRH